MRPVLVYQHQTGFYRSQNKAPFELKMLRTFLHCRFVGIQRCRWRGYSFRLLNIRVRSSDISTDAGAEVQSVSSTKVLLP